VHEHNLSEKENYVLFSLLLNYFPGFRKNTRLVTANRSRVQIKG